MVLQGPRAAARHGDQRRRGRQVTEQIYSAKGDWQYWGTKLNWNL